MQIDTFKLVQHNNLLTEVGKDFLKEYAINGEFSDYGYPDYLNDRAKFVASDDYLLVAKRELTKAEQIRLKAVMIANELMYINEARFRNNGDLLKIDLTTLLTYSDNTEYNITKGKGESLVEWLKSTLKLTKAIDLGSGSVCDNPIILDSYNGFDYVGFTLNILCYRLREDLINKIEAFILRGEVFNTIEEQTIIINRALSDFIPDVKIEVRLSSKLLKNLIKDIDFLKVHG